MLLFFPIFTGQTIAFMKARTYFTQMNLLNSAKVCGIFRKKRSFNLGERVFIITFLKNKTILVTVFP